MRGVRVALVCAAVAMSIPLIAGTARACTCLPGDPRSRLLAADAAAIVSVETAPTDRRPSERVRWRLRVLEALKGDLGGHVEVVTSSSSASCGLGLARGHEYGLLLSREGNQWTSGLCSQVEAAALRRAAEPLIAPEGSGPTSFIVAGKFGEARTLGLDARLRTLQYGFGEGEALRVAVCPGAGRRSSWR